MTRPKSTTNKTPRSRNAKSPTPARVREPVTTNKRARKYARPEDSEALEQGTLTINPRPARALRGRPNGAANDATGRRKAAGNKLSTSVELDGKERKGSEREAGKGLRKKATDPAGILAEWCESHGIAPSTAKQIGIKYVTKDEATKLLGYRAKAAGIYIRYDDEGFFRIRYLPTGFMKGLKQKYTQPRNSGIHVYLCPLIDWDVVRQDTSIEVIFVEGEAKAIKLCQEGFVAVAIGGVDMWRDKRKSFRLHPDIAALNLKDRPVAILFDYDPERETQENNRRALSQFVMAMAMAKVKAPELPPGQDMKKKVGADDYLLTHKPDDLQRLIDDTKVESYLEVLHELSEQFCYIEDICRVVAFPIPDPLTTFWTAREWKESKNAGDIFCARSDGKVIWRSANDVWMENRNVRHSYTALCNDPGNKNRVLDDGSYNSWTDPGIVAKKGDRKMLALYKRWFEETFRDTVAQKHMRQWRAIQTLKPGTHIHHALVIIGEKTGIGKSLFGKTVVWQQGEPNCVILRQSQANSRFNLALVGKTTAVYEECSRISKEHFEDICYILTNDRIPIEPKSINTFYIENHLCLYFSFNELDVLPIKADDRRFAIFHAQRSSLTDEELQDLGDWLESPEGRAAMRWEDEHTDVSDFNPRLRPPMTEIKQQTIDMNEDPLVQWCRKLIQDPASVLHLDGILSPFAECAVIRSEDLVAIYNFRTAQSRQVDSQQMGNAMAKAHGEKARNASGGLNHYIPGMENVPQHLWINNRLRYQNVKTDDLGQHYADNKFGGKGKTATKKRKYTR